MPFLVKTLGAPVVHLPLGQSSDMNAHLPDERIRSPYSPAHTHTHSLAHSLTPSQPHH